MLQLLNCIISLISFQIYVLLYYRGSLLIFAAWWGDYSRSSQDGIWQEPADWFTAQQTTKWCKQYHKLLICSILALNFMKYQCYDLMLQATVAYYLLFVKRSPISTGYLGAEFQESMVCLLWWDLLLDWSILLKFCILMVPFWWFFYTKLFCNHGLNHIKSSGIPLLSYGWESI